PTSLSFRARVRVAPCWLLHAPGCWQPGSPHQAAGCCPRGRAPPSNSHHRPRVLASPLARSAGRAPQTAGASRAPPPWRGEEEGAPELGKTARRPESGSPTTTDETGLRSRCPRDARAPPPSRPSGVLGLPRSLVASGKRGVGWRRGGGARFCPPIVQPRRPPSIAPVASPSTTPLRSLPATEQRSRPRRPWICLPRPHRSAAALANYPPAGPAPAVPGSARRVANPVPLLHPLEEAQPAWGWH
ncbi:unnamed protein product, partial [Urochloa humidicola]